MGWRTPIYRWNRRMLMIERRQWSSVVALIALTVAVGVVMVTAGFNVSTAARETGNGTHLLFGPADSLNKAETLAAETFAVADVIRLSQAHPLGSATPVTIKSFDPAGEYVSPLIALIDGRYPTDAGEVAATQDELTRLGVRIGDAVQLGHNKYTAVGVVENPEHLADSFFFAAPGMPTFDSFELLIAATDAEVGAFTDSLASVGWVDATGEATTTAVLLSTLVAGALLEVGLLSIAVLTVLAQRRVRQLGVLAALGAGQRQVRAAVVAGGVVAGALAVAIGVTLGVGAALLAVPLLDNLAGRRINTVDFPWFVVAGVAVVAFGSAVFAAWWPARKMAALTVAGALRARRPEAVRPAKITIAGVALIIAGLVALLAVFSMSPVDRPVYFDVVAFLAVPVGAVLLAPMAVRLWVRFVPKRGLVSRVALGDVGRYQSRSAATVAALVIILTIPVVAAVGFRTVERSPSNVPTMPKNTVMIAGGFGGGGDFGGFGSEFVDAGDQVDLSTFTRAVDELAARVGARSIPLREPVQRVEGVLDESDVESTIEVPLTAGIIDGQLGRDFTLDAVPTYVASPELLDALGLDAATLDGRDVVTNRRGRYAIVRADSVDPMLDDDLAVGVVGFARYSRTPGALMSPDYVAAEQLPVQNSGWMLVRDEDFAAAEMAALREGALRVGLSVAVHEPGIRAGNVVNWLVVIAALLATGVAAIVSALHRTETADVDVAYESVGASASFRRRVHGVAIATLVFIAAALATVAGTLSQIGFAKEQLGVANMWEMVPPLPLIAILLVVPAVAFLVSWLGTSVDRDGALPQRQAG